MGDSDEDSSDENIDCIGKGVRPKDLVHKCPSDPGHGVVPVGSKTLHTRSVRYPSGATTRKCVLTLDGYSYVIGKHLIPCTSIGESVVFYYKMNGDYHRYLAEFATGSDRKDTAENSLVAYKTASDIAMTDLPPTHPFRLDLVLNFSVFYDEILNSPDRAYQLAFGAIGELESISEESFKGSDVVIQLLREKIKLWKATDRLNQLSEIQRYLDDQVISEYDPRIIVQFLDGRLVEFSYTAATRPTSVSVFFGQLNFPINPKDIICAIRDLVSSAWVRCFSTRTLLAFALNNLQEYSNLLVRLAVYLSDPWFQSVLRQMRNGHTLGFTSSLKTNKITDMEPMKLVLPFPLQQPFEESEVEDISNNSRIP